MKKWVLHHTKQVSGFSGWTTKADESKLNPLFIQIKDLLAEGKQGVLAWDTSLEAEPAAVHNEQVQTLFADGADINEFIDEHKAGNQRQIRSKRWVVLWKKCLEIKNTY